MIKVLGPTADDETIAAMEKVLRSGWWGQGPVTAEFEKEFAKKAGVKHAIAVNSGTAALDLALKVYNIKGGELITSPMTFVSDALVGEWNDMRVTFADIDPDTLCIEPDAVWLSKDTKAIIAVHSHGRLANIEALMQKRIEGGFELSPDKPRPLIIEDCAHACFTPGAGALGDIAIWSFQAVKTLPAGDGGMVTTNDDAIAQKLRDLTWCGINKSDTTYNRAKGAAYAWDYDIKHGGLKAYMNDINAVLALGNLRRIDQIIDKRQRIQENYAKAFKDLPGVHIPLFSHTVQYYTLQTDNRDAICTRLAERGIATSVHFKPLHLMSYWAKGKVYPLDVTERVWLKLLSLPCHDGLTWDEQSLVIEAFQTAVYEERKKGGI